MRLINIIALLAHAAALPIDGVDALLRTYVKEHASVSAAAVRADPCARRFVSADFWGKGLGNSVNVALNALAFAVAANRTLLVSDDARFRAGFWKYLGAVEGRWALKSTVLEAFVQADGCRKCGGCINGAPDVLRDFFPMNRNCLQSKSCGPGVRWMLCDQRALSANDAPVVHVRSAVTWLAPLILENKGLEPFIRARLERLFPHKANSWGALYGTLLDPQPEVSLTHPLRSLLLEHAEAFDLGLHVRHRRAQPLDAVDAHAAKCAAKALQGVPRPKIFVATDRPSRLPGLFLRIERALGRPCDFRSLNASRVPMATRLRLHSVARLDEKAMRAGRDWGEHAHERWTAAADFFLLSRSRRVVGTLSSSYSELAAAARGASEAWLFDPVQQFKGRKRARYNWPRSDEYLEGAAGCRRSDAAWPLPQYVRLRPEEGRAWVARGNCDVE